MVPDFTAVNPDMAFNKVDLPEPEGPKTTINSPSLISKKYRLKLPADFRRFRIP